MPKDNPVLVSMLEAEQMKKVAMVQAAVARALIRLEAAKAANEERRKDGFADAYSEGALEAIIDEEGIGHNSVVRMLND